MSTTIRLLRGAGAVAAVLGAWAAIMLVLIEPWVGIAALSGLLLGMTVLPRYARRNEQEGREHRAVAHKLLFRGQRDFFTRVLFFDFHEQRLLCM